eukprot:619055-Prorocentrum_minimum.AAC.2
MPGGPGGRAPEVLRQVRHVLPELLGPLHDSRLLRPITRPSQRHISARPNASGVPCPSRPRATLFPPMPVPFSTADTDETPFLRRYQTKLRSKLRFGATGQFPGRRARPKRQASQGANQKHGVSSPLGSSVSSLAQSTCAYKEVGMSR